MRLQRALAVSLWAVLAGCASSPPAMQPSGPPVLVLLPAYVSYAAPQAARLAQAVLDAQSRALSASGRYSVQKRAVPASTAYRHTAVLDEAERLALSTATSADAFGLTDVVQDTSDRAWKVHFRIVGAAAGEVVETFSTTLPWGEGAPGLAAWTEAVAVASPPEPLRDEPLLDSSGDWTRWWSLAPALPPEAERWKADLLQARFSGDHSEAYRLADLLVDRVAFGADAEAVPFREKRLLTLEEPWVAGQGPWLHRFLMKEAAAERQADDLGALMAALAEPKGSAAQEELKLLQFLDLERQTEATSRAGSSDTVAAAFRTRFGRDLRVMLTRPALVLIEGGTYLMGSDSGEADEKPVHRVTVGSFFLGRTEITQQQYTRVMGLNPSLFAQGSGADRRPVERVSWYDAVEYCIKLSALDGLEPVYTLAKRTPAAGSPIKSAEVTVDPTKNGYRLPTEAEWEWAARGGKLSQNTLLAGGNDAAQVAWTDGTTGGPGPVASKKPNELGLFDMSGNVWEWCADWYGKYSSEERTDPQGAEYGILKVGRGGSWHAAAWNARVTSRSYDNPGSRGANIGFRVVRSVSPGSGD